MAIAGAEEEGFISPRSSSSAPCPSGGTSTLPIAMHLGHDLGGNRDALTFTPVYRSIAVMKIASYTPYIAYTSNEQPMNPEEFTETQIELLRSSLVMEQLVSDQPEIAELPKIQEAGEPSRLAGRSCAGRSGRELRTLLRLSGCAGA